MRSDMRFAVTYAYAVTTLSLVMYAFAVTFAIAVTTVLRAW
jgi:hypothetical protein